jgi:hypothetical protein
MAQAIKMGLYGWYLQTAEEACKDGNYERVKQILIPTLNELEKHLEEIRASIVRATDCLARAEQHSS